MNPMSRRALLRRGALLAAGAVALPALESCVDVSRISSGGVTNPSVSAVYPASDLASGGWFAPADHLPHDRTWMAWPARLDVWGAQLEGIRDDVAAIARAIVGFEPVSLVVRPAQAKDAAKACGPKVDIVPMVNDDLWMRDMGPVFLIDGKGGLAGLDLNFNGWGAKQVHENDAKIARQVLELLKVPVKQAPFIAEGGALEFDGRGTVMATESSIVNDDRNPGKTKEQLTAEICHALGAQKMLWVPGLKGHDITDDHIDSLARFVHPGTIVVDQPADPRFTNVWARSEKAALGILRHAVDARGRNLRTLISRESLTIPPGMNPNIFVNVYVNWYVCNGAVLLPAFDDPHADAVARALVSRLYPGREPVQLRIDNLGQGGGGIHCATQQQPAV